jgi:hypothetical protein
MLKKCLLIIAVLLPIVCPAKSNICPLTQEQAKLIDSLEQKYKLPKNALKAIIRIESCFNPKALNDKAKVVSYGFGQLTAATAKAFCNIGIKDVFDQFRNGECAAKVLSHQFKRFQGDQLKAILAYNEGTPCICDGTKFVRHLGQGKTQVCKEWKYVGGSWKGEEIACSGVGSIRVTQYYHDWKEHYKKYNLQ